MKKHCECDIKTGGLVPSDMYSEEEQIARIHEPNECKCKSELKEYKRNGRLVTLCSACCLSSDEEV